MNKLWQGFTLILAFLAMPCWAQNPFITLLENVSVDDAKVQETIQQLRDRKEIAVKNDLSVGPFHHRHDVEQTQKQGFCVSCHLSDPHRENRRSRSFLNMHSRFISCETCHLKTQNDQSISYRWLAYDYPAAGNMIDVSKSVHTQVNENAKSILARPGAHIAPFIDQEPVLIFKDDAYAQVLKDKWDHADITQKAQIKLRLHQPLEEEGLSCKRCHDETEKLLDLEFLGANQRQLYAITHNKIVDLFMRYRRDDESIRIGDLLR